jgi:hypothetical protein
MICKLGFRVSFSDSIPVLSFSRGVMHGKDVAGSGIGATGHIQQTGMESKNEGSTKFIFGKAIELNIVRVLVCLAEDENGDGVFLRQHGY